MVRPRARPLYRESQKAEFGGGNLGLWHDKFGDRWNHLKTTETVGFDKLGWLEETTGKAREQLANDEFRRLLQRQAARRQELAHALEGRFLMMKTTSPFVTGLGREHPVENGFLWHHTLGVPYLPGSSVKGMIRSWHHHWMEQKQRRLADQILGIQEKAGQVLFLDALPTSPVRLRVDVMTPHYSDYYLKGEAPGDWLSPTPIPFLTVQEDTPFQFVFLPRHPAGGSELKGTGRHRPAPASAGSRLCDTAAQWLKEALEWIGAGAKTSLGYGRMRLDKKEQAARKKTYDVQRKAARQRTKLPEDAAALLELRREGKMNRDGFIPNAGEFLEKHPQPSAAALKMLQEAISEYWPGILEDPDAHQGRKKRPKYKEKQRNLAKALLKANADEPSS